MFIAGFPKLKYAILASDKKTTKGPPTTSWPVKVSKSTKPTTRKTTKH